MKTKSLILFFAILFFLVLINISSPNWAKKFQDNGFKEIIYNNVLGCFLMNDLNQKIQRVDSLVQKRKYKKITVDSLYNKLTKILSLYFEYEGSNVQILYEASGENITFTFKNHKWKVVESELNKLKKGKIFIQGLMKSPSPETGISTKNGANILITQEL